MDNIVYYIALNMLGWSAGKKKELLDHYKDIKVIFSLDDGYLGKIFTVKGFNKKGLLERAEKEFYKAKQLDIGITYIYSDDYPKNLLSLYDPPIVLYYKGSLTESDFNSISVVGCRDATTYGLNNSYSLGYELGRLGITVVSGLAIGIDSEAHKGVLKSGGRAVAVLGCGIDKFFPRDHINLQNTISKRGCIFSEFPIGSPPRGYHFPIRNRIIAGLSVGVVVVEGTKESGSLYTAQFALDYGREVYAFPGNVRSYNYGGTHLLIKKGAKLIENVRDLLDDLSLVLDLDLSYKDKKVFIKAGTNIGTSDKVIDSKVIDSKVKSTNNSVNDIQLTEKEAIILEYLSSDKGVVLDKVVELSGFKVEEVISNLSSLTVKGLCTKVGNYYQRNL